MQKDKKENSRAYLRISCSQDKRLPDDFRSLENTYINGKLVTSGAEVLRELLNLHGDKIVTKEDMFQGNTSHINTIGAKLNQVIDVLMKHNRGAKKEDRFFIDATLLRSIAGTDANGTKKHIEAVKNHIDEHHKTYSIIKDHNVKLRKRSDFPVYQVTRTRNVKRVFYDMMKEAGLLEFLGLDKVESE